VEPPADADDWTGLVTEPIPVDAVINWAVRPDCGALVSFLGTVRDHAEGRTGVTSLEYEAYAEQVIPRFDALVAEARSRWKLGRVAVLHRVGRLELTDVSVAVVVSSAHRGEAFDAGRYCIEAVKATVPIWKREEWSEGADWATGSRPVVEVEELA